MDTDRDKLLRGFRFLAIGFPFIFIGPILFIFQGIPQYHQGNYIWLIVSIFFMLAAAFFAVRGLRTIVSAFFDGEQRNKKHSRK